jgi:hypothetical protein
MGMDQSIVATMGEKHITVAEFRKFSDLHYMAVSNLHISDRQMTEVDHCAEVPITDSALAGLKQVANSKYTKPPTGDESLPEAVKRQRYTRLREALARIEQLLSEGWRVKYRADW